jgi:hypothetical protein
MRTSALNPLLESVFFTGAIMLSAGLGFGMALRSAPSPSSSLDPAAPTSTGGGLLQLEQTFPPRPDWNLDSEEEGENLDGARYNSLQKQ